MKHHLLSSKSMGAVLAVFSLAFLSAPEVGAQTNLDFDPSGSDSSAGGSGSFNTSDFYNENTGLDQLYMSGNNANFYGTAGTVAVDAPVTISTATSGATLNVFTNGGVETFGAMGTTNAITFENTYNNEGFYNIAGNTAGAVFNAPIDIVLQPDASAPGDGNTAGNSLLYNGYFSNNTTGNVTVNNINISGSPNGYPGSFQFGSYNGGTYTFNGAVTNTTTGGAGLSTSGNALLTSTASLSNIGLGVNNGVVLTQTANLGTQNVNINNGSFLADAAGLTITNGIQSGGNFTVGTNTSNDATFTGTFSNYNTAALNLQAAAGSTVHIANNGIYIAGTNVLTTTGPGVVSLEAPLFSNSAGQTANGNISSSQAAVNVNNGTLLINTGSTPVVAASLTIASVAPSAVTSTQSVATLGGTGTVGYFNTGTTSFVTPVTTAGQYSTISPGNMSSAGVSSIGTLTLAGGLDATNGATFNFQLNGTVTNPFDTLNLAGSTLTSGSGSTLTFNFTNLGGALSTDTDYAIITGIGTDDTDPNTNFVFNAPVGYTVVDPSLNDNPSAPYGTLTVEFEAVPEPSTWALIGLSALVLFGSGKLRRLRA